MGKTRYANKSFIYLLMFIILCQITASCLATQSSSNFESVPQSKITATQTIQIPEKTPTYINQLLPTQFITAQMSPTPETLPTSPDNFQIHGFNGRKQYFALGCESSAAVDLAAFYGVEINEYEFQFRLPLSDNPNKGFVGSVDSPWGQVPPYGYGVHAGPVAWLLREYGLPAVAYKGYSIDLIKQNISNGMPVIVWVIGNMVGGIPYEYVDNDGDTSIVAAYEHVVILTGYDTDNIIYLNNGLYYKIPNDVFLRSWGVLENMVVYIDKNAKP